MFLAMEAGHLSQAFILRSRRSWSSFLKVEWVAGAFAWRRHFPFCSWPLASKRRLGPPAWAWDFFGDSVNGELQMLMPSQSAEQGNEEDQGAVVNVFSSWLGQRLLGLQRASVCLVIAWRFPEECSRHGLRSSFEQWDAKLGGKKSHEKHA